jgi:heat shock protein HtpX
VRRIDVAKRSSPIPLLAVGAILAVGFGRAWRGDLAGATAPWWAYLFLMLLAVAMVALAAALVIDPRPIPLRQALAGTAIVWLVVLIVIAVGATGLARSRGEVWLLVLLAAVIGSALVDLAVTTPAASDGSAPPGPFARLATVILFAFAIIMATGALVIAASIARAIWRSVTRGVPLDRLPWVLVVAIVVLPLVTFVIAAFGARGAAGGTFYAQAAANRRNSILLIITMVGIVAATGEIIAVTLTFKPLPAIWAACVAAIIGLGAAVVANRFGGSIILDTAGAVPADPAFDTVLIDVVTEVAIAANIPTPRIFVIGDKSENAFATGRDPQHASVAVTRGLLDSMDREQLQGVIAHELAHIRNLDTRYALYVAVLVGLVALATDGFLQLVVEGWKNGLFMTPGDGDDALAGFLMSLLIGIFLLIVASLLRVVAPLFSTLVQASTSREREFLADATSVEFTRNARGLERALESIARDDMPLGGANRGTQHLWFRNPVKPGSDRRAGLLSTHPSLGARIDRLRLLQGLPPADLAVASLTSEET